MSKNQITSKTSIADLGALVCHALNAEGIDAFLSGGAVVSIYTNNKYESFDLDFVSLADRSKIKKVMEGLGFGLDKGRMFSHPKTRFTVEFPGTAVLVGNSPITEFHRIKRPEGVLKLLTPTDCVKDRLAAFYHWNDRQGLDQAVWVSLSQPVKLRELEHWSKKEGQMKKYREFESALKDSKRTSKA